MAKEESKRSESDETNEQPKPDRSYMRTWGSTRQAKAIFEAENQPEEGEETVVQSPGVNPVISPELKAPDNLK